MRIFSESPLDRRDHTNRLSCHIIHEFRFSRIDFCSAARCRQRAGESGSYDPPRAFTGISRVHSTATVARTVSSLGASYCTRIFVSCASAFARLRAAANARAKAALSAASPFSGTRVSSYSRSNVWNTRTGTNSPTMSVESVCASKRLSASESAVGRKRAGESGFYDPPRAFTGISRVHSTATVARTVPSLGASYCTRIFISRASAFARLRAAANAPESAVGRKRAAPACGRKRLLRPAPRFHGNLPRPLDCHGRAHRVLARRIVLHANLHLPRVGFRPAARRRQCARIRRRKEARHASVRAKTTSTTRPASSR